MKRNKVRVKIVVTKDGYCEVQTIGVTGDGFIREVEVVE